MKTESCLAENKQKMSPNILQVGFIEMGKCLFIYLLWTYITEMTKLRADSMG